MMDTTIAYAKKSGCNYICGVCVAYASLRVYQRSNIHPVAELPYDRYRYKGNVVFPKEKLFDKCPAAYFSIGKI